MVSLKVVFFRLGHLTYTLMTLSNANAGCKFGGMYIYNCSYADDMAILCPSASGLQKLLNICASYAIKHDIIYNVKKTHCMVVPSTTFKLENTPSVFLNGAKLQYVDSYKYLGMFIHARTHDLDIVRQLKCVILRTNILMRTFSSCSVEVKLFLFKRYCSNFHCSHLWYNFSKVQMNKLRITYNNAMRRLFNLHFRCNASEMFANCNIHSMDARRRTCIHSFIQRLKCSSNAIITCFIPSTFIQKCAI